MNYKIGGLGLKSPYFLAPMHEVTDIGFRTLCSKAGAGLTYTWLMNPLTKQNILLYDKPGMQLFCSSPEGIVNFIKKYNHKVKLFDLNLGCPAKTARKHGFGSFLHSDLRSIKRIIESMRESTRKPITIKLRKSKYAFKIVKIVEDLGCDAVCIHPRTQQQGYKALPDIEFAKKLKSKTNLPVIFSGNIDEKNADIFLRDFDFVMIGRNAIGNPNIFSSLTGKKLREFTFLDYLKLAEKYNLSFRQTKYQAMNFTKRKKNAKELRLKIYGSGTIEELIRCFTS